MKICKKCKKEYKDAYVFCPNCGKPYDDNIKPVKTPSSIDNGVGSILFNIWNIVLYIFGSIMILGGIIGIIDDPISSILAIIFGLSLFKIFYDIVLDKTNIDEKYLKVSRVVIPLLVLIIIGIAAPSEEFQNKAATRENSSEKTTIRDKNKSTNNQVKEEKVTNNKKTVVFLENTKAKDFYKILCEVMSLTEHEPSNVFANINEYSSTNDNYMLEVGANKETDEIGYITITSLGAQDPTNAFMALTRLDYEGKDPAQLTTFIRDTKGRTGEITIGDVKFSMWNSNTTNKPVLEAKTLKFDDYVKNIT